jgi:hypothetical protein
MRMTNSWRDKTCELRSHLPSASVKERLEAFSIPPPVPTLTPLGATPGCLDSASAQDPDRRQSPSGVGLQTLILFQHPNPSHPLSHPSHAPLSWCRSRQQIVAGALIVVWSTEYGTAPLRICRTQGRGCVPRELPVSRQVFCDSASGRPSGPRASDAITVPARFVHWVQHRVLSFLYEHCASTSRNATATSFDESRTEL